jgi:hypothetical protein
MLPAEGVLCVVCLEAVVLMAQTQIPEWRQLTRVCFRLHPDPLVTPDPLSESQPLRNGGWEDLFSDLQIFRAVVRI